MGDSKMAKEELKALSEKMRKGEIEPIQFVRSMIQILGTLDITNEDLQGVTPLLLNFVNRIIQNMEKRGA